MSTPQGFIDMLSKAFKLAEEARQIVDNPMIDYIMDLHTPRPAEAYHEDMGPVLWWRFPIEEPPHVGSPLDTGWRDDLYTHFTPLPKAFLIGSPLMRVDEAIVEPEG